LGHRSLCAVTLSVWRIEAALTVVLRLHGRGVWEGECPKMSIVGDRWISGTGQFSNKIIIVGLLRAASQYFSIGRLFFRAKLMR